MEKKKLKLIRHVSVNNTVIDQGLRLYIDDITLSPHKPTHRKGYIIPTFQMRTLKILRGPVTGHLRSWDTGFNGQCAFAARTTAVADLS